MKKALLLLSLFTFVLFSSCEKLSPDKDDDKDDKGKDDKTCFKLVYPVTYEMPDGSEIEAADEQSMWTDIKAWYEAHPDSVEKPMLQYPVDIVYEDGTTAGIADEAAMILAKKACYEEDGE